MLPTRAFLRRRRRLAPLKRSAVHAVLGELPLTAEIDWLLRQKRRPRRDHFSLDRLKGSLPEARRIAESHTTRTLAGKQILIFATLHYWIEQSAFVALALAARGAKVTLLTLPYAEWHSEKGRFVQRQRLLHTRDAMAGLTPLVAHHSLQEVRAAQTVPPSLRSGIEEISLWDTQYTLMREVIDIHAPTDGALYSLRLGRNTDAAKAGLSWMTTKRPDVLVVPNGLILEMGILFRVARHLGIPAVTYEFNDQREQIWLAQNTSIMQQDTDYLVEHRCHLPITDSMYERVADLENARRGARVWGKSKRLWQYVSAQGADVTRRMLGLDQRPVVLLAANVLGDSLTLGRNLFADSMSEWMVRTVQYFARRSDVQLLLRVHPGETLVPDATSMEQVVREALPEVPDNIHIIGAGDKINTYDLIEIADAGLAYTTTVGLETAMNGRPVIVCGQTHYRGRGFTLDPDSWDEYFSLLETILQDPASARLSEAQIERAWNYAYRFFFEYPRPFPWRLMKFWDDLAVWPMARVLSAEGEAAFGRTFEFLAGEPFTWSES